MVKFKKTALSVVSVGMAACLSTSIAAMALACMKDKGGASAATGDGITRVNASIDKHTADYFDSNVVSRLSDNIGVNQEISVILSLNTKSTLEAYLESDSKGEFTDYLSTASAKSIVKKNAAASNELIKALDKANISYKMGNSYEHVLSGFEVILRAKDYNKLTNAVKGKATTIVGEVYAPAEAQKVENIVDVYPTGIFDSSKCDYHGDGVIVAVLDTGLDYTHTAFDPANFTTENEAYTLSTIAQKMNETNFSAAQSTPNLIAEDVYVNKKVPYAYDYADKDSDVFPLGNEHGTHVAGVIAGKDDRITGVAPNAQLAIMKVFSDHESGARTSWILSALDDCVALGVDVINMSLGTAAGFTTQDDETRMKEVYDNIRTAGISLIAAAGNEDNAVTGSEKNGSNPLTSNPDSGIVGSPSTFEAALSVASVGGVKTPYFLYNDEIMYFTEAATSSAKNKDFVDDILKTVGKDSYDFTYVTISGVGSRADYTEDRDYYRGKIVLVKRGETTFESKVNIALNVMKAAGIIVYNNISGTISMQVGSIQGAACSISKDQGDRLAKNKTGIIRISRDQVAGPFMSDFSSWGPTSDLRIKPEITAHGGEIESAIPGQGYDRMSGTSMASPNMAGATALIRQFVKDKTEIFGDDLTAVDVTKRVNQLAMSTADIVYNKNGLAYAVRKQGAGLVNIGKATKADAYISTYNEKGEMDKTKIELGDDKDKKGEYTMSFKINNLTNKSLSYNIGMIVMTEGVNTSYTGHGETTVTTEGYALNPKTEIVSVEDGDRSGSNVTVAAKGSATVTVKITLSEADKAYLDESFEHGMYVEGFITVKAASGTEIDMSVPFLAFYGDWTEAPIFDEEYYDTNADELNNGIDADDKLMEDAYATRVIGGYYSDYIAPLGTYPFVQNPAATKIAANKEHIALSNYEDGEDSSLNKITAIAAGLLRNVKEWKLTITEDSTGKVIWTKEDRNQRKSYTTGTTIYQANMEVDFSVLEHNLKNNTKYTVTVETYIDYGKKEEQNNVRNKFTFPLYIDFEAPIVTGVDYRTEYDKSAKKWHLYADVDIYDNHYAMAVQFGHIVEPDDPTSIPPFSLSPFGKYMTPVYSSYNSTSKVTFELTDYVEELKKSRTMQFVAGNPNYTVVEGTNSFVATCYDYAMNVAMYEIKLPDEVLSMYFDAGEDGEIVLNPNETLDLTSILHIFPETTWAQTLDFKSSDTTAVDIVNQTAIAKITGVGRGATVTVESKYKDANGDPISKSVNIRVRSPQEDGYRLYDAPQVYKAGLTGYKTVKAYYEMSSTDRDIGLEGGTYFFANNDYTLSMYPSESVDITYELQTYFSNSQVTISYTSTRPDEIANVDENGRIVALAKGEASINVEAQITYFGKTTTYLIGTVKITVKDPYTTNGIYLSSYKGLGGVVEIPGDRGFTTIQSYAFSGYDFKEKDLTAGDVIDDEDPYHMKQTYLGEDTITEIFIPEGVTTIESYAFARLTALTTVHLPTTLTKIGVGAFYGCNKLKTINLNDVQFINDRAFMGCALESVTFNKIVAIGSYAFRSEQTGPTSYVINKFTEVTLPETAQSLDSGAFFHVANLQTVTFASPDIKIKLGEYVFSNCANLQSISINATVIPEGAFYNCVTLSSVTLGKDVSVIGMQAFAQTNVSSFTLAEGSTLTTDEGESAGRYIYKNGELVLVAPVLNLGTSKHLVLPDTMTKVANGAFAGNSVIESVAGKNVTEIGAYAFADCPNLKTIDFPKLTKIGERAFFNAESLTIIDTTSADGDELARDQFALVTYIGDYAFAGTAIGKLSVINNASIGEGAFYLCTELTAVTIGNNVTIGEGAFSTAYEDYSYMATGVFNKSYYAEYVYEVKDEDGNLVKDADGKLAQYKYYRYKFADYVYSSLTTLTIGDDVTIGAYAFQSAVRVSDFSLGARAKIGEGAFYDATGVEIDLSEVIEIGDGAFSGSRDIDIWESEENGEKVYYPAVEREINDKGVAVAVDYKYSYYAPKIKEIEAELGGGKVIHARIADLSSLNVENGVAALGEGAFAYNQSVRGFFLPEEIEKIPAHLFANCKNIQYNLVDIPESVKSIGEYAFANTSFLIDFGDIYSLEKVGEGAFLNSRIVSVKFAEGAVVGDSAFEGCEFLGYFEEDGFTVENLEEVVKIGSWAFAGTAMTAADLSGATEIGDYAFGLSGVTTVKLGSGLKTLGENPFFGCEIETFAKTVKETLEGFGIKVEKTYDTYDVNDSVKVIGGVLYQVAPNGLVLVSYPAASDAYAYTVEDGTVRISARAFAGAPVANVTLPRSLKAIGDKAFFACKNLTTVIFNSLTAPILEEEFDATYMEFKNHPLKGYFDGEECLGISDYFMWNSLGVPNYYYGATFIDYVGAQTPNLVMVSPVNGTGYDTFIFGKYFGTFVKGSTAITDNTLQVIKMIADLKAGSDITLADEAAVEAARRAYDALPNLDQKALVTNYSRLTNAESTIEYLKSRVDKPPTTTPSTGENDGSVNALGIAGFTIAGVLLLALAAFAAYVFLGKKKAKTAELDSTETVNEESSDDTDNHNNDNDNE